MSARLLIAVADDETARRAAAQAREAEMEVVDIVAELDEIHRALRRLDVDVVLLYDALGGTPVLDLARDLASAYPEVGLILLAAEDTPGLLRAAMQAGLRDVVALPLALESFESSVRAAAQWSRTMRDRVAGEESAGARARRPARRGRRLQGRRRDDHGRAAPRARRRPDGARAARSASSTSTSRRAISARCWTRRTGAASSTSSRSRTRSPSATCRRRSTRTRRASGCCSRPRRARRAEDVDSAVARNVLAAVKARHALTVVDIGAVATEATAIAAEMATLVVVVTTPDVLALRGVRRMRDLWKRLSVREDEDVRIVLNRASRRREIQPDLARKVVGDTMAQTTIPADFNALEAAVNTGSPSRLEDNKLRGAFEALATELDIIPRAEEAAPRDDEPRGLLARLGGERGQSTAEFMGLLPILLVVFFALWQIALTGFTYTLAGHAANEGARQLAIDSDRHGQETRPTARRRATTCRRPGATPRRSTSAAT